MVLEVALDLEPLPQLEAVERLDQLTAEPVGEDAVGPERDLADHAGHGETLVGPVAGRGVVVVAVAPRRIHADHPATDRPPADLLRRCRLAAGDDHDGADPLGVHDAPLERLHAAHRPADDAVPAPDAELVGDRRLAADHVADRHHGEAGAVGASVVGMERRRAGRALAAAEDVDAHDEEPVGVDRLARPDRAVPPAGRRVGVGRRTEGVAVAGQRVTDEDRVRCVGVERPPGLVRDRGLVEHRTALERERPPTRHVDESSVARVVADLPGTGRREGARVGASAEFGERSSVGTTGRGTTACPGDGGARDRGLSVCRRHVVPPPRRADTRLRRGDPGRLVAPEGHIPFPEEGGTLGVRSQVAGPGHPGRS